MRPSRSWIEREERRLRRLTRAHAVLDRASFRLATARLAGFSVAVAGLVLAVLRPAEAVAWRAVAAAGAALFVAFAWRHRRPRDLAALAKDLLAVAEREASRARGEWRALPRDGGRFAAGCPHAGDLAVFGRSSLFQALSRCATSFGEERLAAALARGRVEDDVLSRQDAVRELAPLRAFRARLEAVGARGRAEGGTPAELRALLEGSSIHDGRPWLHPLLAALVAATLVQGALELTTELATGFWPCLLAQGLVFGATMRRVAAEYEALLEHERALLAWSGMMRLVESRRLRGPLLSRLKGELAAAGVPASVQLARLQSCLASLALRSGSLHPVVNTLVLWDLHHVARLARVRREALPHVEAWFTALGEVEALSSLAAHSASLEGGCVPELDEAGPFLAAEDLRHALLPAARVVGNELELERPGTLVLLTGSNMSGKSTLLRAAGLAVVLAAAGGAVPARRLRLRPCRVLTSIHVTDALDEGVSLFHAEVLQLKRILDAVGEAERDPLALPVLYLVDEILRGTNTRERLIASRAVIRRLASTRSAGLVTSHDLSLVELEGEVAGLRNMHFRESVADGRMTFDYRLRPGPVTTTNALLILKAHGIEVD